VLESRNLIVFGYSGHSYVVIEIAVSNGWKISGYYDKKKSLNDPYEISYLGVESDDSLRNHQFNVVGFPATGNNKIRQKTVELLRRNGINETAIISSDSVISPKSIIEPSTFVSARVVINCFCNIGNGCIINTGSIIEHECQIGAYTHVAPGAVLAGGVKVGSSSFIGANSTVRQGVRIGNDVIIGAGSTVLRNIPDNETWVGSPAKRLK
jgi:sugar O-acyltransferase (sialic acid O-acetyltransferase NeuD family)